MTLAEFILTHMEDILGEWEAFAKTRTPAAVRMNDLALRDHAKEILEAVVSDIVVPQSPDAQRVKSLGLILPAPDASFTAAHTHAVLRSSSGFDINQLVAEYRALRSSVLRLWAARVAPAEIDLQNTLRFNEAIDQALAESVASFSSEVDTARKLFAGMLGHDMRTPLQVVLMSATLLERRNEGVDVASATRRLVSSGTQLKVLIDDFLDFNRAQLGLSIEIEPAPVNLANVLLEEVDQQRAANPGVVVMLDATGNLDGAFDGKRLRRLLGNLVANALKYGDRQAPVRVIVDGGKDEIVLSVSNQGARIDAGTLHRIFEPLQRGSAGDALKTDSSLGLGLYICREIASAHGGVIEVASDAAATTFTVRLPRERAALAAARAQPLRRRPPELIDDPLFLVQVAGHDSVPDTETGRLLRQTDWAATPLGPIARWPQSLRVAVSICLNSRFPMFVWWGPALVNIYNDAYVPMLGQFHPQAFAKSARTTWGGIWDVLLPQVTAVMRDGNSSWNEKVMLTVDRHGSPEAAWFTWSYSPIYTNDGAVGGLFCAVVEEKPDPLHAH